MPAKNILLARIAFNAVAIVGLVALMAGTWVGNAGIACMGLGLATFGGLVLWLGDLY